MMLSPKSPNPTDTTDQLNVDSVSPLASALLLCCRCARAFPGVPMDPRARVGPSMPSTTEAVGVPSAASAKLLVRKREHEKHHAPDLVC